MPLLGKNEDVEAKYDVTLTYPNLELHSAAASGNVGLVHYALTHGQPVNSVLHGVLPLHAACSGGSVSVVKMLIERGADVNAPRLPRRYSDGKKSTAPSIGAAGSTPLHFAAANGHAAIAQILLTCGAIPNKEDKNGMTPEALAEINGHTDVIRVLRVWEHLAANDPEYQASVAPSYAASISGEPASPADSYVVDDFESRFSSFGSRKGKERGASFASNVSGTTSGSAVKLKNSLEGLFKGRASRSGSMISNRPNMLRPNTIITDQSALDDSNSIAESSPASPNHPVDSPTTSTHNLDRTASAVSVGSAGTPPLLRITSADGDEEEAEEDDNVPDEALAISPPQNDFVDLGPSPSRHNPSTTGSSRRPSLPSIFEKAVHPGAAFRAALRRDHHKPPPIQTQLDSSTTTSSPATGSSQPSNEAEQTTSSHGHGFFRGRTRSNDSPPRGKAKNVHRYNARHAITHLFRRGHSPPSRSPSPPRREAAKPIEPGQIEEGMEKMRRASLDLDMRENGGTTGDQPDAPRLPTSAPPTKTTFFADSIATPIPPLNPAFISLPPAPPIATPRERSATISSDRPRRARQASEVIAPSPLSNEWAGSSDSDSPSSIGIRRSKTEVARPPSMSQPSSPRSALQSYRSMPPSPLRIPSSPRHRSVTSPSTPVGSSLRSASGTKLPGLGWNEPIDLRKVAAVKQGAKTEFEEQIKRSADDHESDEEEDKDLRPNPTSTSASHPADDLVAEVSQLGSTTTKLSDETEKGGASDTEVEDNGKDRSTSSLEVAITESSPVELASPSSSSYRKVGRYRGASIGSVSATTESSRISTPPASSTRMSFVQSDDDRSIMYNPYTYVDSKMMPPPPPPPPTSTDGRARGKSVSSTSSVPSDMSMSYLQPSTPATSLTPQSTLSIPLGRFPPVPENEVAHHPGSKRTISNRAEAREAKKQAEEDVLQLAQLPPSLDSSRSLAAQLAAYGESHAIEEAFAAKEKVNQAGSGAVSGADSESESWFSALSDTGSKNSSGEGSGVSKAQPKRRTIKPMSSVPAELLPAGAHRSSLSSINAVYDKRAAAYRERMAALTALPPSFPAPATAGSRSGKLRTVSNDSWLTTGSGSRRAGSILQPETEPLPVVSGAQSIKSVDVSRSKLRAGSLGSSLRQGSTRPSSILGATSITPGASSLRKTSAPSRTTSRSTAPAPIADVISTRYAGMSPPPHVPQPPRLDPNSPYISIFSNRYGGAPHDGDESDDDEQPQTSLTVVENDWTRARVGAGDDGYERKGRWGQFKGAMGRRGRR